MRLTVRAAAAALITLIVVTPCVRASAPDDTPGLAWTGAVGVRRTVEQLMSDQRLRTAHSLDPRKTEPKKVGRDRRNLPQAQDAPAVARWPLAEEDDIASVSPPAGEITAGPFNQVLAFDGASLFGINPTFSFPPDNMGAVGPSQFVVFVNGRLVTFDKATGIADGVMNLDPDVFFAPINNGSTTTDPRVRYDRLSGRWFLVIINTSTPNWVLVGVSDAASNGVISGATVWSLYFFPINTPPPAIPANCFADHPTLGVDANALYIGTSNFCGAPLTFNSCDGFVVRKSSVTGGGPIVVTALRGLVPTAASDGPFSPQGVDNYDPAATEGYFVGVSNTLFGRLVLRRVSTPGSVPGVSANINIAVPSTLFPIRVPHLGNTGGAAGNLAGVDDRLIAAHLRNGRLWTAHNIGVNNTGVSGGTVTRNGSRWYELQGVVSPGVPGVFQAGTVFDPSATNTTDRPHFWMPSVMVSGQGHALIGMSTAGTLIRIDATTAGRLAGDAPGTMSTTTNFSFSGDNYNPPADPGGGQGRRWGDYTYTSLDPIDDMSIWSIQQWCDANNSYGCRVVRMRAPLPAAPASASDVSAGQPSIVSFVVGTSTGGSGFYDPGPNLPGGVPAFSHMSAVVTATGVTGTPPTVNSVTYVDPTHVQLNLNTTGATPNLPGEKYSVKITNPDGQVATGNQILLVTPAEAGVGPMPEAGFALGPVWPNPAAGSAGVDFTLPRETRVRVSVVDLGGREVAVLTDGVQPAGTHHLAWSGATASGRAPAGMYFMRYEAGGGVQVRRFVMLR